MDVSTTTAMPNSTSSTAKPTASGMADYNTFLQLLIAQAKNQDPTNPTDPSQYVQQFASLSQVEQAVSTNTKLDQIISSLATLNTPTTT
jgi:flagellar basal-body rod modification protein FlgD